MPKYELICERPGVKRIVASMPTVSPLPPKNLEKLAEALRKRFPTRRYWVRVGDDRPAMPIRDRFYSPVDFIH